MNERCPYCNSSSVGEVEVLHGYDADRICHDCEVKWNASALAQQQAEAADVTPQPEQAPVDHYASMSSEELAILAMQEDEQDG